jgi:hypothetical protein
MIDDGSLSKEYEPLLDKGHWKKAVASKLVSEVRIMDPNDIDILENLLKSKALLQESRKMETSVAERLPPE